MNKVITVIISLLVIILLVLLVFKLLGYDYNKNYFSYDRNSCITENDKKIEGCIFWLRVHHLETTQNWNELFEKDESYCDQMYKVIGEPDYVLDLSPFGIATGDGFYYKREISRDPKCNLEAFKDKKRKENWDYLISDEIDGAYDYCVKDYCPKQKLFY